MTHLYEALVQELKKELELCKQMTELLELEKDVIPMLDYKALQDIITKKQEITSKIKEADIKRNKLMSELGFKGKTLADISGLVAVEYQGVFEDLANDFKQELKAISELNSFNSRLIEKSLFYLKTSFNFLSTFNIAPKQRISVEV